MTFATLLPQIRTDEAMLARQMWLVGFSTTAALLAIRAQPLHSLVRLMKRPSFAQNVPKPEFEAMDFR
jgi:hypothetical protein